MGRRRIKMVDSDIWYLESHYHDFYRITRKDGVRGTAFIFDKLTDKDIETIKSFKNTVIQEGKYKYAPEITNYRVILMDTCKPFNKEV